MVTWSDKIRRVLIEIEDTTIHSLEISVTGEKFYT